MVHNGIEYGDMQVIAEAYHLMSESGMSHDQMSETFAAWGSGPLKSFLIEITSHILAQKDSDGGPLVEAILDSAGQKGTGKWTVISSMDLAQPVTLVSESVYARIVSSFKDERMAAHGLLGGPKTSLRLNPEEIRQALYASKVVSYAQGFMLLRAASDEYGWDLDYGRIAGLWREGCIIRAAFLDDITNAFGENRNLPNLMIAPFFREVLSEAQPGWRNTVAAAVTAGIPVPAYSSALSFYDSYRTERLPANLIQAQRDYFGAHTYERIDKPRGIFFHTNWTGHGGDVTAGSYQV
jgi:6-phosphogluconate dehydrogenase